MLDAPRQTQPSLRRRLLAFLLIPVGVLLLLDALLTYGVALAYSNRIHDRDLSSDAESLAELLQDNRLDGALSPQARFLLEYDPDGRSFFSVRSSLHGLLEQNASFPQVAAPKAGNAPVLFDSRLGPHSLRAAIISIHPQANPADTLTISVAETLQDRHRRAREILLLAVPLQSLLIVAVLSLVWFGVNYGLRVLQPLTERLAAREHDLTPIGEADVPMEILPLTRTIDGLFARLRGTLELHERFIADAAHQLRTPLAGLILHVEGAVQDDDPERLRDALGHIRQLTLRTARTCAQLLALTRAQSPLTLPATHLPVDLARLVPETVGLRVSEALAAEVDLGYEGTPGPLRVDGDPSSLQELLDNLIDNALRYAGRGSHVTVGLVPLPGDGVRLRVEDDGPGVPDALLARLGERFFRAPDATDMGTGLGLAIVERIAEWHGARVSYHNRTPHGLQVDVQFPPAMMV
ncbi:sensor histidine kinase N-terminal domain-containing protein [Frateuria sp. STR12]|nr:sensor histidine kinase [Frateuria sp. STR12]MCX7515243.1 sensor histidine kinase N-terminal domain-containing protein [Frateuria sp. STR12]